jgi:hypothetical protein
MTENKPKSAYTSKVIRFLIYIVIGFAVAFIYRQIKN